LGWAVLFRGRCAVNSRIPSSGLGADWVVRRWLPSGSFNQRFQFAVACQVFKVRLLGGSILLLAWKNRMFDKQNKQA
jgi:hypothetical protein